MPANLISPGVYINEYDFTEYANVLGRSRLAVVGGATKGKLNTPTVIASESQLVDTFGPPLTTDYGLQSAIQFLKKGGSLVYCRVADDDATNGAKTADVTLPGTTGASAAVFATGTISFTASTNPLDAETITLTDDTGSFVFEFDNDAAITGTNIGVLIGANAAATMANLLTVINASAWKGAIVDNTVTIPSANLTSTEVGVLGNRGITETGLQIAATGMSAGADAVAGSAGNVLTVFAATPGTWANTMQVVVRNSLVIDAPAGNKDILVYAVIDINSTTAKLVEQFNNVNLTTGDSRNLEPIIEGDEANGYNMSGYINVTILSANGTLDNGTYVFGSGANTAGQDGITTLVAADYVGTVSGQVATGLKSLLNPERTEFNLIAVPGVSHTTVVDSLIATAESRKDCLALVDPPFGLDNATAINWHNGTASGVANAPASALNTSYGEYTWGWVRAWDAYNKVKIWLPPSGYAAAQKAYTDQIAGPQFPATGHVRGVLDNALELEYSPDAAERSLMIEGTNRVNPIVDFIGSGPTHFGNRTLLRTNSVLRQTHVRRVMLHAEKLIATSVKYLVFDPNDPVTWWKFTTLVNGVLEPLKAARGLEDFRVICDETTNPSAERKELRMKGKILLKPVDAVEVLMVDFSLFATGATFTEL